MRTPIERETALIFAAALSYNQEKECPVSRFEVEQIVTREVEKMRRDFRRLRENLKEAANDDSEKND